GGCDGRRADARAAPAVWAGGTGLEPVEDSPGRLRPFGLDRLLERAAGEVLHDDERAATPLAHVVDRDDVRVAGEPGDRERLAREPLAHPLVLRMPEVEKLDRDGASERR